jgi:hypothetical protein
MIHGLTLFFQITIRFQTLHACDKHLRELKRCFGVFGSNIGIHNPVFTRRENFLDDAEWSLRSNLTYTSYREPGFAFHGFLLYTQQVVFWKDVHAWDFGRTQNS